MSLVHELTAGRRVRRILRRLAVSAPFELEEFRDCLERRSGRPVHLIPAALPAGSPSGVCIRTAEHDYLYFEQATSPFHQAHIQVCLAAHLLLNEEPAAGVDPRLVPQVGAQLVKTMLGASERPAVSDRRAEAFALSAMERAGASACPSSLARWFLRQIGPLHSALLAAVPEVAVRAGADAHEPARQRLHRQVVEIRDAGLALRPYRNQRAVTAAAAVARASGLGGEAFAASVEASVLAAAITARHAREPAAEGQEDTWQPPFELRADLRSEAGWLAKVSRAYARLPRTARPPAVAQPGSAAGLELDPDGTTRQLRSVSRSCLDGHRAPGKAGKSRREAWRGQS